jgi:hypothetical protein
METLKNLKLGKEKEITFSQAKELIRNTVNEYDFNNLNENHITKEVEFETVQNRAYSVTKIGKKGSIIAKGSEYEAKAKLGVFVVEMTWDYKHPTNFCENKNNCNAKFQIEL